VQLAEEFAVPEEPDIDELLPLIVLDGVALAVCDGVGDGAALDLARGIG
jgi:hypothetical protein